MTASDGSFVAKGDGVPHHRNHGSFPRKICEYVLERGVTDLASAIRDMTSLPATVYRLNDRGLLRPVFKSDIVIFDSEKIRDTATFTDPHQHSEGVIYVIVNGILVIDNEEQTGLLPGEILKRVDL